MLIQRYDVTEQTRHNCHIEQSFLCDCLDDVKKLAEDNKQLVDSSLFISLRLSGELVASKSNQSNERSR